MSFDLQSLIPEHIALLKPYLSARDEFNDHHESFVFLDANELPEPLHGFPANINRYPGNEPGRLKEKLAVIKKIDPESIFLGNGSDEIIDLIMRCFARAGKDEIMTFPPTFGMYANRAVANNLSVKEVPLDHRFMIRIKDTLGAISQETSQIYVCHPNNPSGNLQAREHVISLLEHFHGIVVVDEAYIDFSPENSLIPLLAKYPNLIVLQTFSKAFGLAGARVGVAYASADIVRVLEKVRCPYNIGSVSAGLAEKALNSYADYLLNVKYLRNQRDELAGSIAGMPLVEKVYPSDANFLLVKTSDAGAIYNHLVRNGVVVRNRDKEAGCSGCVRITVGTAEENQRLLNVWRKFNGNTDPSAEVYRQEGDITGKSGRKNAFQGYAGNEQANEPGGEHLPGLWEQAARRATIKRKTAETDITLKINLDGKGYSNIETGIGFFDHMLQQIAKHGLIDLEIHAVGDLETDPHHTIEDTGITLGAAVLEALGGKKGLERYGFSLPMDDSSAQVMLDFGGRFYLKWDAAFAAPHVGGIPASLFGHFFRSFAEAAKCNLHIQAAGEDDHHKIEAIFKAFAKTLRMATRRNSHDIMPSTKGVL